MILRAQEENRDVQRAYRIETEVRDPMRFLAAINPDCGKMPKGNL